jgi:hypothetical protein
VLMYTDKTFKKAIEVMQQNSGKTGSIQGK